MVNRNKLLWLLLSVFATRCQGLAIDPNRVAKASPQLSATNSVFKHLYRHYDDISFDSYLRCMEPRDFLKSVGYSDDDIDSLSMCYTGLLQLHVHSSLAPKIRFLVETLGGGSGRLTWDESHEHSMRVSQKAMLAINPALYFDEKCRLDRFIGPRHAYLKHTNLPHGTDLLDQPNMLHEFIKTCRGSTSSCLQDFVALCNKWEREMTTNSGDLKISSVHTPDSVQAFERSFGGGLIPLVKQKHPIKSLPTSSFTASSINGCEMIELLVHHGANYMETDTHGILPLHWAAGTGKVRAVKALVEAMILDHPENSSRADAVVDILLNAIGNAKDDATAFHWACCGITPNIMDDGEGSYQVCRYLLEQTYMSRRLSELVNAKTRSGNTPLMWAIFGGSVPIIDLLSVHGADPSVRNCKGQTVAHWAVAKAAGTDNYNTNSGNLEICRYLRDERKVDFMSSKDSMGKTPRDYAKECGNQQLIDWILQEQKSASSSSTVLHNS